MAYFIKPRAFCQDCDVSTLTGRIVLMRPGMSREVDQKKALHYVVHSRQLR